jgi:flagellar biosynthesis/type III secretory pathway chaperone
MNNTIQINLQYNELKKILTSFYKSAVNSYEDLAEIKASEVIDDIINKKHLKNINCVNFSIVGEKIEETQVFNNSSTQLITTNFTDNASYTYSGNTIITADGQNLSLTFSSL